MIFDKPLITKANVAFFLIALLVGVLLAFGIAAILSRPAPMLTPSVAAPSFTPIPAPPPAIPTVAPVVTPDGAFTPAPAPVIVTTQPLPAITPTHISPADVTTAWTMIGTQDWWLVASVVAFGSFMMSFMFSSSLARGFLPLIGIFSGIYLWWIGFNIMYVMIAMGIPMAFYVNSVMMSRDDWGGC